MSIDDPLPYVSDDPFAPSGTTFRVLESYDRAASGHLEPLRDDIRGKVSRALDDFPELVGETVTVARLGPDESAAARADSLNRIVFFPTHDGPSPWQNVYHELAHLAIDVLDERGEDVPTSSEEFCSILAVSRMPVHLTGSRSDIAYLGEPSRSSYRWPHICRMALRYRDEHGAGSHYIKRCKEWLGVGT